MSTAAQTLVKPCPKCGSVWRTRTGFAGNVEIPDGAGTEMSGTAKTGQAASRGWPGRVRVKPTGLGRGSGGGLGRGGVLRLPHSQFCQIQRTRWAAPRRIPRIGQRRQGNIIVRRARRRARAVHHCGDHFCPRVGAATARELILGRKTADGRTKFGREGAGTFQCPRPLYIGRNLTFPVPWHLSMPRVGPCLAPPACRTTACAYLRLARVHPCA